MNRLDQLQIIIDHIGEEAKHDLDIYTAKDYKFLFAVILSSQTTDEQVNKVTPALFQAYPSLESFARANWEDVAEQIKSLPFFRNKAKNLIECANQLINDHNSTIPSDMDQLVQLRGVGRKVANVIRNEIFGAHGIVTDTHVIRVSNRLQWVSTDNPGKVEKELSSWIPEDVQAQASSALVLFGRYWCQAKKPKCSQCPLNNACPKVYDEKEKDDRKKHESSTF